MPFTSISRHSSKQASAYIRQDSFVRSSAAESLVSVKHMLLEMIVSSLPCAIRSESVSGNLTNNETM